MESMSTFDFWSYVGIVTFVLGVGLAFVKTQIDLDEVGALVADMIIAATPVVMRALVCFALAVALVSTYCTLFM